MTDFFDFAAEKLAEAIELDPQLKAVAKLPAWLDGPTWRDLYQRRQHD